MASGESVVENLWSLIYVLFQFSSDLLPVVVFFIGLNLHFVRIPSNGYTWNVGVRME